jgi:hypothetical protein
MFKLAGLGLGRWLSLIVVVAIAVVVLAAGPSGCGGSSSSGDNKAACLSCAMSACPTQAAACDASPGCKTLRACSLACRMGDSACQNSCTAAVASDTTAVLAGANYLSCATTACPSQCSGTSATGSAGTSGGGGMTGSGGQGGAGGTGGVTGNCAAAKAKLDNCGFAQGTCSDTDRFTQCANKCVLDPSNNCSTIGNNALAYKACVDTCDILDITNITFTVADGGYITAGAWKGYAWTATDGVSATTISPANFSTLAADGKLCVSGTVAGTADYSAVAILGISINQAMGTPAPAPSTWSPTGTGITYGITNTGGSPLRVQLQAAGGSTDATKRWCYTVNGDVGTPQWSDFNTKCWDHTGAYYDGATPLESVMVLVPGDLVGVPYSFCVNALAPHP